MKKTIGFAVLFLLVVAVESFGLQAWYVDSTTKEITIAWEKVPTATSYVLQRSLYAGMSGAANITLENNITA